MLRQRHNGRKRSQLMREELSESAHHAAKAAGHAASGMRAAGAQMAPMAGRMRTAASQRWGATMAAFDDDSGAGQRAAKAAAKAKLAAKASRTRTRGKQKKQSRAPRAAAMLAVGAAVGAVWAMAQRRRRQQWDEYEPSPPMDTAEAARAVEDMAGGTADVVERAVGGEPEPPETGRVRGGEPPTETVEDIMSRSPGEERQA